MIELVKYFRILFLSAKISLERLKGFTEDHIQRLAGNNPGGIFTQILNDVTVAYNAYFGDLASESLNEAVKEGKTIGMKEARKALEKNISDNEGQVRYTYRDNDTFYEEFYPHGVTEYLRADLATFETITLRYRNVLADHAGDFTPQFSADFNTFRGTFVTNRNLQLSAKGDVAAEKSDIATTKPALAEQLTVNLLTIALEYVGDESKADVYFDQAILNAAFNESAKKVTADINPDETQNVFDNISQPDVRLRIRVTGDDAAFNFGFKAADNSVVTETTHQLTNGADVTVTSAEWGWTSTNKNLNVTNPGAVAGSYVVEKI